MSREGQPTASQAIDEHVAANVRYFREQAGLSQEELALRVSERGFGFTQATIWKIETGQRPAKISETVALGEALDVRSWTQLTDPPERAKPIARLQSAARNSHQTYSQLTAAASAYLEAQLELVIAVREARDAGLNTLGQESWLEHPAERAVLEARVNWSEEDQLRERHEEQVDTLMNSLREAGYEPLRPEDVT